MPSTPRPFAPESIRLIVFDLDGTLIDSRQDLCNSVNAALKFAGLQPLPDATIASFIGDGAALLIRRALAVPGETPAPLDESLFERTFAFFLDYYRAHKLDFTELYPGVRESLEALKTLPDGTRRAMAVLTNKPVGPALAICEGLGLTPYFFSIYGGDSFPTKKPDPLGLRTLMNEARVSAAETLMIGDSDVDVRTARNCGAWTLGCLFGLAPESLEAVPADLLVNHAAEWMDALGVAEVEV
jgi:phosphoglycolate phosphatase